MRRGESWILVRQNSVLRRPVRSSGRVVIGVPPALKPISQGQLNS